MHPRLRLLLAGFALGTALHPLQADDQADRVAASFLLAQGRPPAAAELADWSQPPKRSLDELLARHRQHLQADAGARTAAARAAWIDTFGAPAASPGVDAAAPAATYAELVQSHLRTLAADSAEYRRVLDRAYRLLLDRAAYSEEVDYWRSRPALPFVLLVACIENWARRNQPGLTVTSGTPSVSIGCGQLATVRLSPAVAAEARKAIGLVPEGWPDFAAELGRHVVAPGAAPLVAVGRIHFAAAGAEELRRSAASTD